MSVKQKKFNPSFSFAVAINPAASILFMQRDQYLSQGRKNPQLV